MKNKITLPIVIEVTNISSKDFEDVSILSVDNIESVNFGVPIGINLSVKNIGLTYKELLEYLKTDSFIIGKTYFQSTFTLQTLELAQYKNGDDEINLKPIIDLDNEKNKIIPHLVREFEHKPYELEKNSSFIVSKIYGSSTLLIYFY